MIKAVIYDMDDLMVNSNPLHIRASEKVFRKYGIGLEKIPQNVRAGFIGMRVADILRFVVDYFNLVLDFEKLRKQRSKIFFSLVAKELKAMPGLMQSLEFFKKNNFKIALASSGTKEYINLVLKKFKLAKYFDVVVSGDDVKFGKPDPETYLIACKKLQIMPKKIIVLEDATKGIDAAKTAGCICIAVKNPYTLKQNLAAADLIINSLTDLNSKTLRFLA